MSMGISLIVALLLPATLLPFALIIIWHWKYDALFHKKKVPALPETPPRVAILVSARNEGENIEQCIRHLLNLDYPTEKLKIYLGDDSSTDDTVAIMKAYAGKHKQVDFLKVTRKWGKARGKANVLAQLINADKRSNAPSQYYLITDADVRVTPGWVKGLLGSFGQAQGYTGIINGFTLPALKSKLSSMQAVDWIAGQSILKFFNDQGKPLTAVGNNMLISREAYEATGGYEIIPFSITEDHALFEAVSAQSYNTYTEINKDTLAYTKAESSWKALIAQRLRWMYGASQVPLAVKCFFGLLVGFYPMVILLCFLNFFLGLLLFFCKWAGQCIFAIYITNKFYHRTGLQVFGWGFLGYEFYEWALNATVIFKYFFSGKVRWKGRVYSEAGKPEKNY